MRERSLLRRKGSIGFWVVIFLLIVVVALMFPHPHHSRAHVSSVKQQAQLHSLDAALELFRIYEGRGYPPSDANDGTGQPYCGAMKLAEAIMGQDLLGFHSASGFRVDGLDPDGGTDLYVSETLPARKGPYMQPQYANAYLLVDVYGEGNTGPFAEDARVLCDMFIHKRPGGKKTGTPILYYKADPNGTLHDPNDPDNPGSIYHWRDNAALVALGVPGDPAGRHPLADPNRFYMNIQSDKTTQSRPYRADSFIFISAGEDGLYGTADDICNFDWKYRE